MITANELRLGNLVNFMEDDTIFTVEEIVTDGIGVHNEEESTWIEIDQFSGIPLTEEWLLKFGFTWSHYHQDTAQREYYGINEYYVCKLNNRFYYENTKLEYIHQLQNLVFALTGTELELKS